MNVESPLSNSEPFSQSFGSTLSSRRSTHTNVRSVIDQMQAIRLRYLIRFYQKKLDYSQDSASRPRKKEEYKEIISNFIDILVSRRRFGVSNPRDMIFAHSGLVPNLNISDANYNDSVAQIFENLARHPVTSTESYQIFSHVKILEPRERRREPPSWVPD
jgi:hypothetical protein